MRNGVFWLSLVVATVSLAFVGAVSQPRSAEALPGDICQMIVWDSTGRVLENNDFVGGNGQFFALARVEDDAFGFVGDFLEEGGLAAELIEEALADLEARILEIETRLAEIEVLLENGLTDEERADLENEQLILEDELFALEEILREIREALERFGNFNIAQVDAQTGSARIRSHAEVGGFADVDGFAVMPRVYHRLIPAPGVATQKIDHMFPDFFADPDGHVLNSIRAWLAQVAGVPVPDAVSDATSVCGDPEVADGWKFVDLVCFQAGSFHFSIRDFQGSTEQTEAIIRLICPGQADTADIRAMPTFLETEPVGGHTDTSIVTVTVYDQFGDNVDAVPVRFLTTNNCTFKNPLAGAAGDLGMSPAAGGDVVTLYSDTDSMADANFLANHPLQTMAGTAEVALDCSKGTPGTVTVTAIVDRPGADITLTQQIMLVGPALPGGLSLVLTPDSLECGEILLATATAVDINGAPVSDGTRIFFTTDTSSGIIGGREGAQGSNLTIGGETTVTIAVAPNDPGIHSVIAWVVNNAGTPSAQISTTFECHAAVGAAVPTVSAPATGTGSITPPNTGDGGLLQPAETEYPALKDGATYAKAGAMLNFLLVAGAGLVTCYLLLVLTGGGDSSMTEETSTRRKYPQLRRRGGDGTERCPSQEGCSAPEGGEPQRR